MMSSHRLLGLLLLTLSYSLSAAQEDSCPAQDNSQVPWGAGDEMFESGECKDKTAQCSSCSDLCDTESYSHWMTENCPATCGQCSPVSSSILMSDSTIWRYGEGYSDSDVLSRTRFTTVKACQDQCLATSACVGAFITEYIKLSNMECVLAKRGSLIRRKYMFGATKTMLQDKPAGSCDNHWGTTCARYAAYCTSRCPYLKRILTAMCPKQCNTCQSNGQDDHDTTVQWKTETGKKMVGDVEVAALAMEEAKKKCCEMGAKCKGLTCKNSKCKVMTSCKKLKKDSTFTTYTKA